MRHLPLAFVQKTASLKITAPNFIARIFVVPMFTVPKVSAMAFLCLFVVLDLTQPHYHFFSSNLAWAEPQQGSTTRPSQGSQQRETVGSDSRGDRGSTSRPAAGLGYRETSGSSTRASDKTSSPQNLGSNTRKQTSQGSGGKNASDSQPLLTEGTSLKNVIGRFEINGARVFFKADNHQFCCTENLMLQRVYEMSRNLQSKEEWTVDGTISTYMDKNYLTVENARRMPRTKYSKPVSSSAR